MAIKFNRSQTFATNGTVTAAGLHNLIDGTDIYQALITDQTVMTSVGSLDKLLIADSDLTAADAPRSVTVNELFEDALTLSTYTNVKAINSLYTNATGNYTFSTGATITTGTIPSLISTTLITTGTGTSSNPAIAPIGDLNTGLFFPASDTIAFADAGSESLRITSNGQIAASNSGSSSAPVFTRSNDLNTGVFFPSADAIAVSTNGTEALRIDSGGKVGVNSSNPLGVLHVGNGSNQNSSDSSIIVSRNIDNNGTTSAHGIADNSLLSRTISGGMAYNSFDARVNVSGSDWDHYNGFQMLPSHDYTGTMQSSIGFQFTPSQTSGTLVNSYGLYISDGGYSTIANSYGLYTNISKGTSSKWSIYCDGIVKSYFGGGVGIGTTSIDSIFHIRDSVAVLTIEGTATSSASVQFKTNTINRYKISTPDSSADLAFYSSGTTERIRFKSDGKVGIGVSSPSSALHISGDITVESATTASSASAGARTLPANPVDFLVVSINGTSRKIPYYAT